LVEHQSAPDRFMPLRLLRYVARILDAHRRRYPAEARLPAVIPIVLYHDAKPWPYPPDLGSLFDLADDARAALRPYLPELRFLLDDLAAIDVAGLTQRETSPLVTVTLFALKRARHSPDFAAELHAIARFFSALEHALVPDEQLSALLEYIWTVAQADRTALLALAKTHAGPKLEALMTTPAEQCREEGRQEGRAEGRNEGRAEGEAAGRLQSRAEVLLKLVQLRFGGTSAEVTTAVAGASIEQLDQWIERVMTANSVADLIRGD
jgi:hypothetical protein